MPRLFLFHLSFETLQHCLQIKKLEIKAFSCSTKDPIIKHTKLHQKGFGLTCPQPESSRIPTVPSFCHNTSTVLRNGPIFYTNLSPKHLFFFLISVRTLSNSVSWPRNWHCNKSTHQCTTSILCFGGCKFHCEALW